MKTIYELANNLPDELGEARLIDEYGTYCIAGWMLHEAGIPDAEIQQYEHTNPSSCDVVDDVWPKLLGTLYGLPLDAVENLVNTNDQSDASDRLEIVQCELLKIVGEECPFD